METKITQKITYNLQTIQTTNPAEIAEKKWEKRAKTDQEWQYPDEILSPKPQNGKEKPNSEAH